MADIQKLFCDSKLTSREKSALKILNIAKNIILKEMPKGSVVGIFVGGSFIRREMNKQSDIDTWTIVKKSSNLQNLKLINTKLKNRFEIPIGISGYSLWELKTGKISLKGKQFKTPPPRFVKSMPNLRQIYGKPLSKKGFFERTDIQDLAASIKAFDTIFLPKYYKKEIGFQQLLKQVLWIIELELKVKQIQTEYSWNSFAKVSPKRHIIHNILFLRKLNLLDNKKREKFIREAKKYLESLKKLN